MLSSRIICFGSEKLELLTFKENKRILLVRESTDP